MACYPIVSRNQQQMAALGQHELPDFYMEDFSVLGLCVDDCERAAVLLDRHQFALRQTHGSLAVDIQDASQASAAIALLNENGMACELADVAQGMYQG